MTDTAQVFGDTLAAARVFFDPNGIAVVGASPRPGSFTANALRYLARDYDGPIYPVNPKYEEVAGLRCYPTLASIGASVDLALSSVPARLVPDVIDDAAQAGVRGLSVFAAGFSESGADGAERERDIIRAARAAGVRIVGPNCQGTVNFHKGVSASFSRGLDQLFAAPGSIAYLGQSGAIGSSLLNIAQERGVGFSLWASTGNQADLGVAELAAYALADPQTTVLMLYVEDISDGATLLAVLGEARDAGMRVALLRSGRTAAGRSASMSHTGAVLGSDHLSFDIAARRAGAALVHDIDELLDVAAAMAVLPAVEGPRIGVVTTSGAAGILAADLAPDHGLTLAELSGPTCQAIQAQLPGFAATANPVDVTYQFFSDPKRFTERGADQSPLSDLVETLGESGDVDVILVVLTMVVGDLARALVEEVGEIIVRSHLPVLFTWLGGRELTRDARAVERHDGVLAFSSVSEALRCAGHLRRAAADASASRNAAQAPAGLAVDHVRLAALLNAPVLAEHTAQQVLDLAGIPHIGGRLASDAEEAVIAADALDSDLIVLKLHAPGLAHRSQINGVRVGLGRDQVSVVTEELLTIGRDSSLGRCQVLVQRYAPPGMELLVGATWSEHRQPILLTVGLGGTATEVHQDLVHDAWPTSPERLCRLLQELRVAPLLRGYRGVARVDVDAVALTAWKLGALVAAADGRIREMEVNPLLAQHGVDGVVALDALVITEHAAVPQVADTREPNERDGR